MRGTYSYFIAEGNSPAELRTKVLDAMARGDWTPIGGVTVQGGKFYQAMLIDQTVEEAEAFAREREERGPCIDPGNMRGWAGGTDEPGTSLDNTV